MKFREETTLQRFQAIKRRKVKRNMRTHSKGKKTAKRKLVKALNWERKKWKALVSAPRGPSKKEEHHNFRRMKKNTHPTTMQPPAPQVKLHEKSSLLQRSLGTRGGSHVHDSVDGAALADWDGNGSLSFSSFNSPASLSCFLCDLEYYMGAEELLSDNYETSQAEGGPPLDYQATEAEGITRGVISQIYTGSSGSIMAQELDGNTVTSDETELAPSAQMLITDSGLETLPTADENVENSPVVSRPPFNRDNPAEVSREIEASLHQGARAALNQGARAALNQGAQASLHQGARAALNQGARAALNQGAQASLHQGARAALNQGAQAALIREVQAVPNQGNIVMQQEVVEVDDIGIGNPRRSYDVDIHDEGFRFRYQYQPLIRDVDLRAERSNISLARSSYRSLHTCATCFQRPRQALNLPCRCLCNCLDCDRVMTRCTMCQRPIRKSVRYGLRY